MNHITSYFRSTIGLKQLMGLTGLVWSGFLLMHMAGNLLIFGGAEMYNKYSHAIVTNPLLIIAEILLVMTLLAHIFSGVRVTIRNRCARPVAPARGLSGEKKSSFAVKTMIYQGVLILVFVILHLITFKYGTHYTAIYNGVEMRDLYKLVLEVFHQPVYLAWYLFCLVLVGLHLSHGFYSSFQTLGLHHPSYNPKLKIFGHIFAVAVCLGFIAPAVFVYLFQG